MLSNGSYVWTDEDPDVELIEPSIVASIDANWMLFGQQRDKPAQSNSFTLINHGDHPFAFKIVTTDNYTYFVSQVYGIVNGKQIFALPTVRTINSVKISVSRRPTNCFKSEGECSRMHKVLRYVDEQKNGKTLEN
ncbi:hypothetical protein AB6A40_006667 [Gnathostoma spinigerum]|uniref:Major sperm protein n=1 Tax=Gnathostoma spinigerum TaxID=75299 RepID=A0ABD6EJ00_9BILA